MKVNAVPHPELIAIVDRGYARDYDHWISTVRRLSELPADPTLCVQIRVKSLPPEKLEESARQVREAFQNRSVTLSWNGDPRIAALCGFDACHQPQANIGELDKETSHLIHSASVHDEASLKRAESCGVDFVIFGPIFEPHWKKAEAQGINELARVASLANVPVVAIGGVNLDTVSRIAQGGACGIACLSSVMDAPNPIEIVTELQSKWRERGGKVTTW
ncbi:MAG: thiamine phosphate synthase [Gammaproteobacteria bacterium]|nr:thiamine phosphate synthase [Gammaproteobacteria bacterium]